MRYEVKNGEPSGGAALVLARSDAEPVRLELDEQACVDLPSECLGHPLIARMIRSGALTPAPEEDATPPLEEDLAPQPQEDMASRPAEDLTPAPEEDLMPQSVEDSTPLSEEDLTLQPAETPDWWTEEIAAGLEAAGLDTLDKIAEADDETLLAVPGLGRATLRKLRAWLLA